MKILLLSEPRNPHTIKWANGLIEEGIEVLLFGLSNYNFNEFDSRIKIKVIEIPQNIKNKLRGNLFKLYYIKALPGLKKIIKEFQPDIIHSHYVSSYGILGALTKFHPFVLTVWGYDILTFPKTSFLHTKIIEYTLSKANKITASSIYLGKETSQYTRKEIEIVPFGIDLKKFKPQKVNNIFPENCIVIGTIKQLEEKYGIENLIEAFHILKIKDKIENIRLLIVGNGSKEKEYKNLVSKFGINDFTIFTGEIPFSEIVKYHNMIDISVFVSRAESFGVAIIEAGAVENPVVVSNVGGLPEVVENEKTGLIVPKEDSQKTADAIRRLILDTYLRKKIGIAARKRIESLFSWENNLNEMIDIYKTILKDNDSKKS